MNDRCIFELCRKTLGETSAVIERCGVGQGNYVYLAECCGQKFIVRCSEVKDAYQDTVRWLEKLSAAGVLVPKVMDRGSFQTYEYLILSYLEGKDIGLVYPQLTKAEKREIAREVVRIQDKVSELQVDDPPSDWSWRRVFVDDMLERAEERILTNGYFDAEYLLEEMQVQDKEKAAFLFYSLIYCVDFMGERGMEFLGRTVEVNRRVIDRLNGIYDRLLRQWEQRKGYIK